jgi:renalase
MKKIAIIGAGIAGLACARVLSAAGNQVHVFDKGRGPGGRMSTRRAQTQLGEVSFDHGAQYFTARDPDFVAEVERLSALGAIAPWTETLVRLHIDGTNSPLANETLYVGTPGMNGFVRTLAEGVSVAWSTRVETIARTDVAWHLTSETGEDLGTYDQVVCAVPAEQVAPLMGSISPSIGQAAEQVSSLPCWTGMFAFDRPLCIPFDAMRVEGHPSIDIISMNHSKPARTGPASYVVQAHADWSIANLEQDAACVAVQLYEALIAYSDDRPNLIFSTAHRWRYARVEVSRGVGHMWDKDLGIGACGDWLSGPRVESAWLSGHHLGQAIVANNETGV